MSAPKLTASDKAIVEATAACIGGVCSTVVFYPLDTAKTRYQAGIGAGEQKDQKDQKGEEPRRKPGPLELIWLVGKHEGVPALYRGMGVKIAHTCGQTFLYFYAYSFLKRMYETHIGQLGTASNLAVGMLAGCFNVLFTQPLDTLSTLRQMPERGPARGAAEAQPAASPSGRAEKQRRAGTWAAQLLGTYKGVGASLTLTTNPAIQYTVFEQMRRYLLGVSGGGDAADAVALSSLSAFLLGAASKSVATAATYPMIRSKVMLQTGMVEADGSGPSPGMLEAGRQILHKEGPSGLYKGLGAQLLKTVLAAALMLAIKEKSFSSAMALMLFVKSEPPTRKGPPAR